MVHDERAPEELHERITTSKRNYVSADTTCHPTPGPVPPATAHLHQRTLSNVRQRRRSLVPHKGDQRASRRVLQRCGAGWCVVRVGERRRASFEPRLLGAAAGQASRPMILPQQSAAVTPVIRCSGRRATDCGWLSTATVTATGRDGNRGQRTGTDNRPRSRTRTDPAGRSAQNLQASGRPSRVDC